MRKRRLLPDIDWRLYISGLAAIVLAAFTLIFRLGSLIPSLGPSEESLWVGATTWHSLLTAPEQLPLKVLIRFAAYIPSDTILYARLPSVVLGLIAILLILFIMHKWHGRRTMFFGFALFVCSAWFLHIGRFVGTDIVYVTMVLALLAGQAVLSNDNNSTAAVYAWLVASFFALSIPGLVWFVVLGTLLQLPTLLQAWTKAGSWVVRISWALLALISFAIPAYAIIRSPAAWRTWLGLPMHFAPWRGLPLDFLHTLEAFVYRAPHNPEQWLGMLPLLSAFTILMFAVGCVFYAKHWQALRTRLLGSYLLVGLMLATIGGVVPLSVTMPVVYLIAIAGMAYGLHLWLRVFPRNGIARAFGILIVAAVLALSCLYNLEQYFVAWPHNAETQSIYHPSQ